MSFSRRFLLRAAGALVGGAVALGAFAAKAEDTIKIGILHSLSGTMAISETTLKDVMLMLIDEQNKKGGVLGKKLEAVVVDPASNWPLFAEKARELIAKGRTERPVTGFRGRSGRSFRARLALMQTPDGKWRVEFDEPWAHEGAKPPDAEVELEPAAEPAQD